MFCADVLKKHKFCSCFRDAAEGWKISSPEKDCVPLRTYCKKKKTGQQYLIILYFYVMWCFSLFREQLRRGGGAGDGGAGGGRGRPSGDFEGPQTVIQNAVTDHKHNPPPYPFPAEELRVAWLTTLCHQNCPCMIINDHTWSYMIIYDHIWSYMIIYDHIWSYMIIYGHLWSYMIIH